MYTIAHTAEQSRKNLGSEEEGFLGLSAILHELVQRITFSCLSSAQEPVSTFPRTRTARNAAIKLPASVGTRHDTMAAAWSWQGGQNFLRASINNELCSTTLCFLPAELKASRADDIRAVLTRGDMPTIVQRLKGCYWSFD
jgi:hypothetical protein